MLDDGDRHVSRTLLAFVTTALDSPDTTADAAFRRAARLVRPSAVRGLRLGERAVREVVYHRGEHTQVGVRLGRRPR